MHTCVQIYPSFSQCSLETIQGTISAAAGCYNDIREYIHTITMLIHTYLLHGICKPTNVVCSVPSKRHSAKKTMAWCCKPLRSHKVDSTVDYSEMIVIPPSWLQLSINSFVSVLLPKQLFHTQDKRYVNLKDLL